MSNNNQAQDAITEQADKKHVEPPGCGKMPYWWFEGFFKEDCHWHDAEYDNFDKKGFSLIKTDAKFYWKMLKRSWEARSFVRAVQATGMAAVAFGYGVARKVVGW